MEIVTRNKVLVDTSLSIREQQDQKRRASQVDVMFSNGDDGWLQSDAVSVDHSDDDEHLGQDTMGK